LHRVEIIVAELFAEVARFVVADAVLARHRAAVSQTHAQDVARDRFGLVLFAFDACVVQHERMQVSVAGVEHVGDAEPVFLGQTRHGGEHLGQPLARYRAIDAVIVRRDAPDRRKRRLAAGPEQKPLLFRARDPAGQRAAFQGDRLDARQQMIDLGLRAVELDDQQRLDVERIAGMDESFGGVDRRLVHHFHAAGNDPGADDPRHAFAGRLDLAETDHQRARGLGLLQDPHGDLGNDAEQAFGACDDAHQVVAAALGGLAADLDDFARDQHDFAAQHVVGGHAVFQAMHAAGILRDIAADRAGNL